MGSSIAGELRHPLVASVRAATIRSHRCGWRCPRRAPLPLPDDAADVVGLLVVDCGPAQQYADDSATVLGPRGPELQAPTRRPADTISAGLRSPNRLKTSPQPGALPSGRPFALAPAVRASSCLLCERVARYPSNARFATAHRTLPAPEPRPPRLLGPRRTASPARLVTGHPEGYSLGFSSTALPQG